MSSKQLQLVTMLKTEAQISANPHTGETAEQMSQRTRSVFLRAFPAQPQPLELHHWLPVTRLLLVETQRKTSRDQRCRSSRELSLHHLKVLGLCWGFELKTNKNQQLKATNK